ncbi:hypothetical protein QJS04_geneDACA013067 [Acorus gramineus]|uniref:Nodulin-like domain-containing protein n=1 Tax=Acorus gramineus TaxID=55184 RepID=A0AAV9B1P6_ACOGR|nr:hypothetical protein QJS04_geneDACA013067 [Acorus gramineus]
MSSSSSSSPVSASEWMQFGRQVIRGRWFMVFASCLIMSAAGATYMFGIYSSDLKSSLGYSQQTLNTISFFKDLGANVGVVSGLINEVTPPSFVLAIGAVMNLFGYLMIYLAITNRISKPSLWQMCLYICIGANSQSFANTGSLVTCVKNFPESRGVVLGLLKGFVGLSGAIITQLYLAFYGSHDTKAVVLLIAWLPAAISLAFLGTVRIIPPLRHPTELRAFYRFLYISLALAAYLMIIIILDKQLSLSSLESGASAIVVISLLLLPLAVVVNQELLLWTSHRSVPVSIKVDHPKPPTPTPNSTLARVFKAPARGENYTILQALVSVDMLVLFFTTICGVGGTLTAIDNMGQIGASLGYPKKSISTFVSLISIWNYLGRVTSGFASEAFLAKYKFPRPLMLTMVLLLSCAGHLLIAFGVNGSLYVASVVIGFCFGAQWPLLFAIISEIFGLKYYATLYNFGAAASPIGSYVLNVRVAGHLYDREAMRQAGGGASALARKDLNCVGVECFRLAFFIITAATLVGAAVSMVLVWRTREFYKGDIYARYRGEAAVETGEAEMGGGVEEEKRRGEEMKSLEGVEK